MVANGAGVTAKGVEFDVSGQITPAWEASGGYTYLHAAEADGRRAATTQPRHLLRLATSYRFDGNLAGLKAGASMTAQSATYSESWYGRPPSGTITDIPQAGYALVNAMASYALSKHASVQLNVNNLLDKSTTATWASSTAYSGANRATSAWPCARRFKWAAVLQPAGALRQCAGAGKVKPSSKGPPTGASTAAATCPNACWPAGKSAATRRSAPSSCPAI